MAAQSWVKLGTAGTGVAGKEVLGGVGHPFNFSGSKLTAA